jgi:tripartite-type tricarboxylate transporter receptor subunit TctC
MASSLRALLIAWLAALATLGVAAGDRAERSYPRKTIVLICPWSPGGGTDRVARYWADALSRELGQPVIVVNKTGGSGAVGHTAGAYARPDGYTLAMITFELSTMHRMGITDLTYQDFTCVIQVNADAAAILVRNDAPWQHLGQFLEQAAGNPGHLKMSGTATGGAWDLARAGLQLAAGVPVQAIVWVPTKGAAPSIKELLGGHIDAVCCSVPEAASQIEAGQLRVLAIMSEQRHPDFPDVPTAIESGVPWVAVGWRGLAMPRGTPPELVEILDRTCRQIAASDEYRQFMQKNGFGIAIRSRDEFRRFLQQQDAQWQRVVQAAGYESVDNHDPGPMFFPGVVALLLAGFSTACWLAGRKPETDQQRQPAADPAGQPTIGSLNWLPMLLLLAGLTAYVIVLPWLGFTLGTLVFSVAMLRGLGSRWLSAVTVSLVMVGIVQVLFVTAFKVQLPSGQLGLPF